MAEEKNKIVNETAKKAGNKTTASRAKKQSNDDVKEQSKLKIDNEIKVEPVAKVTVDTTIAKEQDAKSKKVKKNQIVTAKNSIFMLSLVGLALSVVYVLTFIITSIVVLATGGEVIGWLIALQTATVMFFVILSALNYASVKTNFDYKKCNKYFVGELIVGLVVAVISPIGYSSYFTLLAVVPILIVSAVKLWIAQAIKPE